MQLELLRDGDGLTARPIGELDHHAAGEVREKIDTALLRQNIRVLRIDLSGLTFMDSSGVGLIMGRYRLVRSLGGTLTVTGAGERLRAMLRLAGLDKLPIWADTAKNERSKNDDTTDQ